MRLRRLFFSVLSILLITFSTVNAYTMSEEERTFLTMYFSDEELQVVSTTRSLKSVTRVAENVEVVTKEDIELMNAHTVAEALNNITGLQMQFAVQTPGFFNQAQIQGSDIRQVAIFMDGIPQMWLSSQVADLGLIPVQMVKKIEIIKGPASSAWGSSLGGVINIITKSPSSDDIKGTVSASYGKRETGDFRAELTGTKDRFGYYLYAGKLKSDGLIPSTRTSNDYFYSKLSFDASKDTQIIFTLFHANADRGRGESVKYDFTDRDNVEQLQSTLSLKTEITKDLELNLSARAYRKDLDFNESLLSTGEHTYNEYEKDTKLGGSGQLLWRLSDQTVTFGADFDKNELDYSLMPEKADQKKYAVYLNDSITIGKFNITPGIRYDKTDIIGDFVSPSLGATYDLGGSTILRAFVARGFTEPSMFVNSGAGSPVYMFVGNPGLKPEEVWSYQAGVETTALKYLWLKVSAYRHDVKDAITGETINPDTGSWRYVNKQRVRRQGVEAEIRTQPFYHFTLSAGAALQHQEDRDTGEDITESPKKSFSVSVKYDDEKTFRALLTGSYIDWNSSYVKNANAMLFDLNMIKKLMSYRDRTIEVFMTGHNIFNGSQYFSNFYPNARRWAEAGVRMKF